ncbi:cyclic-di-AMP phosphodiesterase PgpH [Virgibacillus pantothenticus]|uniref:HD family phosphohydrolase n=1 Tax=Virgibacillus pantothenticus TaxID=1473 RepID=UPI00067CB119|nr:HDIG domain-containing metalloprotein [Virgibacillus pantothenticus]MEB5452774.1 HDIG domain-containing protein [Virgibacillus pantothenticus]MEB5456888.1 HDIG domain-containing protein [Virgibacillus pantothenticus]MEB5459466.1 HDIG domain-containing protein [Virgibacillus pantothenticus]MEB5465282.1 HDIG domain-containing protein [Virgibacillus pantothenticus]MEB5467571.1 HDIG domain-containing protein [Virgibacillus pantothenticus]
MDKKKFHPRTWFSFTKRFNKWGMITTATLILGLFFFLIMMDNVQTETYEIERFSRAKETIRSPVTIENKQETERKTRETVQAVEDRYNIDQEITDEQIAYITEIFDAITKLEEELKTSEQNKGDKETAPISEQEKVQQLKQILSADIQKGVSDDLLSQLIQVPKEERDEGKAFFLDVVSDTLNNGVRTENTQSAISNVQQEIKYSDLDADMKEVLTRLSEFAVVENSFFDVDKTSTARKEAASNVEPVVIRAGEIIVREGQVITNEVYEKLDLVGVLDKERNFVPGIGLALLVLLIASAIAHEMNWLSKKDRLDMAKTIAIVVISMMTIALMKIVSIYTTQVNQLFYIMPIATGALLMKQLIHERSAVIFSTLFAILGSVIFNHQIPGSLNVEVGIYFMLSQLAAIFFLRNVKDRLALMKAGVGIAMVNIMTVLLFIFLSFEKYALGDMWIPLSFAAASAFLSAVLTIGLLPYFEAALGILSDIKLLQLSSPNHPLLKKLLTEAPGTYHHSVMVANLSEAACESVGANGLLARVGAYYHDLGKTVRPHYFIENQLAIRNPHDFIEPKESAKIIISHPYDGAEMLKKHRLPKEIIDIAKQHHGTSLLKYFYFKDKEQNDDVEEAIYRYPGPKPQTKEAAIISICDSVEAAVRSLQEPTEQKIEEIVASIIEDKLIDGQFNECPITLQELNKIQQTTCSTVKGIFHSRIQYPMKEAK